MYPLELQGRIVRVREFEMADVDATLQILGDDRVTQTLSFNSRSRAEVEAMLSGAVQRAKEEPRLEYYMAIDAPTLVGFVRLGLTGVKAAKFGCAIHADMWGKGYAKEASELLIDWGFRVLGLHRISAAIGPDNSASLHRIKKAGFFYEGTLRDHVFTNGAWRDSLLFSLLSHEWPRTAEDHHGRA
jgi:[ribosomal protein S5]-alanine N-acetyltransferase